jgi:hypothetical protein
VTLTYVNFCRAFCRSWRGPATEVAQTPRLFESGCGRRACPHPEVKVAVKVDPLACGKASGPCGEDPRPGTAGPRRTLSVISARLLLTVQFRCGTPHCPGLVAMSVALLSGFRWAAAGPSPLILEKAKCLRGNIFRVIHDHR